MFEIFLGRREEGVGDLYFLGFLENLSLLLHFILIKTNKWLIYQSIIKINNLHRFDIIGLVDLLCLWFCSGSLVYWRLLWVGILCNNGFWLWVLNKSDGRLDWLRVFRNHMLYCWIGELCNNRLLYSFWGLDFNHIWGVLFCIFSVFFFFLLFRAWKSIAKFMMALLSGQILGLYHNSPQWKLRFLNHRIDQIPNRLNPRNPLIPRIPLLTLTNRLTPHINHLSSHPFFPTILRHIIRSYDFRDIFNHNTNRVIHKTKLSEHIFDFLYSWFTVILGDVFTIELFVMVVHFFGFAVLILV